MKKNWTKPQLLILVKGNSDEVLTTDCKAPSAVGSGPLNQYNRCNEYHPRDPGRCQGCASQNNNS
jgi:hypothetical protein